MPINLKTIPQKPGVYQFKDTRGDILYVGKASSLKSRVASYFQKSSSLSPHKQLMVNKIKKVEYIITSSETEALLLESNLIKKYQPPHNIDLKDDKYFLYIKVSVNEDFPRVFTARKISKDGALYFGPYAAAGPVYETLRTLRQLFPHRSFPKPVPAHQLKYLIKRYRQLLGPDSKSEYKQTINRIIKFLKGRYADVARDLQDKMDKASQRQQFEKAAFFRDKIRAIEQLMEKQKVISPQQENQDIVSLARAGNVAAVNLFSVRCGKLINKQNFLLKNIADQTDAEVTQAFIERFYPQTTDRPEAIVVPQQLTNKNIIEQAFKIKIIVPQKGTKRQYLALGRENAAVYLDQQKTSWEKGEVKARQALNQFKDYFHLKTIPRRIEVFDISNIQGISPVGSMVVFTNGRPDKKWYRKFKIKTVGGSNDPAMMAEVTARRFAHVNKKELRWPRPDLIILDGGKGQLGAVQKKVKLAIPTVALAKKEENIYLPNKKKPINFPQNSEALFLIERMRDEAHRFAVSFFRKTHRKYLQRSRLDSIPGLGLKTKRILIKKFGSVIGIQNASEIELTKVVGEKLAHQIKESI